ncbi:MAG: hypothetical protein MK102_07075 [Fuerstiella sp.]|nr:hypothetical protein [Fuerstiella sp.]
MQRALLFARDSRPAADIGEMDYSPVKHRISLLSVPVLGVTNAWPRYQEKIRTPSRGCAMVRMERSVIETSGKNTQHAPTKIF